PDVAVQAPPNLSDDFAALLDAGIDDWGGVSPVTIDHVNPEAPWPEVKALRRACESRGLELAPRLTVYPRFVGSEGTDGGVLPKVLRVSDSLGLAREDSWAAGSPGALPFAVRRDAVGANEASDDSSLAGVGRGGLGGIRDSDDSSPTGARRDAVGANG